MTTAAFGLILTAALLHAIWNLLAKRAGGGAVLVWLYGSVSAVLLTPIAAALMIVNDRPVLGPPAWFFILASAFIHVVYFLVLQRGYQHGDLSVVYPVARGTGPVLTAIAAILLLGERPSMIALLGVVLMALSVFALARPARATTTDTKRAVAFGLLTGVLIATQTLCDKRAAVGRYGVPPLIQQWGTSLGMMILLAPEAFRRRDEVRQRWRSCWQEVVRDRVLVLACPGCSRRCISRPSRLSPRRGKVEYPLRYVDGHAFPLGGAVRQADRRRRHDGHRGRCPGPGIEIRPVAAFDLNQWNIMSQRPIDLTSEQRDLIEQRLVEFVAGEAHEDVRKSAESAQALPLLFDWSACLAIRSSGEVVWINYDEPHQVRAVEDERERNIGLFQGSRRYPELRFLVPRRPPEAIECSYCGGTGKPTLPPFPAGQAHLVEGSAAIAAETDGCLRLQISGTSVRRGGTVLWEAC